MVKTINFNLEDLNKKISEVDNSLKEVLKDDDLYEFIKQIYVKNQALEKNFSSNLKKSKDVKNKMELINKAMIRLNSQ